MIYILMILQVTSTGMTPVTPAEIHNATNPMEIVVIHDRAEVVDSFERATLAPWTTSGDVNWGIRDTLDTYGPQGPAYSGYQYAGHPDTDIPEYPSSTQRS